MLSISQPSVKVARFFAPERSTMRKLDLSLALAIPLAVAAIPGGARAAPTDLVPATTASEPAVNPAACVPSGKVTVRGGEASWTKCSAGGSTRVIG